MTLARMLAEARALPPSGALSDSQAEKLRRITAAWTQRCRLRGRIAPHASEILDRLLDDELAVLGSLP